ncbi:MAG: MCE family protein, partial [Gemmatimonadetes bacterium]|nr:MCE family protein [Gemmatimonadota bacterium]
MSKAVPTGSRQPSDDEIMRAIPPARRVRELRVGLFVILGLSGFFIVLFTMTNPATFRGRYTVLTQVEDAGGMRSGDAVTMRGVHIGRVRGFDLTGESGVLLTLEIERGWEIPVGSWTEVRSTGFLGGMVVSVVTGPGPGFVEPGTLLPGANVEGALDVAAGVADEATDVLARIQGVLSDSTVANTEAAVRSLRNFFDDAADMTSGWSAQVRAALDEFQ